jgi:hypothetical protein
VSWLRALGRDLVLLMIGAAVFSGLFIALSLLIHGRVNWR